MIRLFYKFINRVVILFARKNSLYYINGAEKLPPPLSAEEEQKILDGYNGTDKSVKDLLEFFQTEKELQQNKEKELLKQQEKEQEELLQEQEIQEKKEEEFLQNINTIAENTNTEVTVELLQNVSTLMEVNIVTSGLLIGIVCISLFASFFKK